jgi:hypothetical protein
MVPETPISTLRIALQRREQVGQRLVGRIGAHRDHAVVGAERRHPAHVAGLGLAELALREIEQRAAGKRHQRVAVGARCDTSVCQATAPIPPGR